jgi:hypothetical protein
LRSEVGASTMETSSSRGAAAAAAFFLEGISELLLTLCELAH